MWTGSPVELVDVLDVPKQSADLLGPDQQITLIDDVGQVILQKGELSQSAAREQRLSLHSLSSRWQPNTPANLMTVI